MIVSRPNDRPGALGASRRHLLHFLGWVTVLVLVAGCASQPRASQQSTTTAQASPQPYPDVVEVNADVEADGNYRFEVTISSPYDSPDRYADAWRILAPDGTQLAIRELLHHHAGEQPFTRSLSGVELPDGIETVTVEGRDLENGWGGATVDVNLGDITP